MGGPQRREGLRASLTGGLSPPSLGPDTDAPCERPLISRGVEEEILPVCRELGIGITAYGVLSRGLLSGHWSAERDLSGGPDDLGRIENAVPPGAAAGARYAPAQVAHPDSEHG